MSSCYIDWKEAKTGELIPIFDNGKSSSSLYNPQKDAEQFTNLVANGTTVIVGLANGLHIHETQKKFPSNKIIVIEKNRESLEFLKNQVDFTSFKNITICIIDEIEQVLIENYYPPLDGNFQVLPIRTWVDANKNSFELLTQKIKKSLDSISRDISVQSHFGKIWHHNIIQNLQICEKFATTRLIDLHTSEFPTNKIAYIAGAGPSLEKDFNELKKNREKYFIISTDTAYLALKEQNIICDIVISIDAQFISHSHFIGTHDSSTIFAFDLCANSIPIKKIIETNTILFFKSNHPFCLLANNYYLESKNTNFFPTIESTGGTVTLAALELANTIGFQTIHTSGCDFCYSNGKTYAQGIYMDRIFNSESNMIRTTETLFSKIMHRTELIHLANNKKTTPILQVYKDAYELFFKKAKTIGKENNSLALHYKNENFPTKEFFEKYKLMVKKIENNFIKKEDPYVISILPYLSWQYHNELKSKENFQFLLKTTIQSICLML